MIPILFEHDATVFTTHGIGDLTECIRCESAVNADGEYELEFEYPVDGKYVSEIKINRLIVAKVNDHDPNQIFRIYSISKEISGIITVSCQHISYDIVNIPVKVYKATTCSAAMAGLKTNAVHSDINQFTFTTDITIAPQNQDGEFKVETPASARTVLLDGDDSIKGTFGGDLVLDNYSVSLLQMAGQDRGTLIEYGVDLVEMKQEQNISEMYTAVYPYWKGREENQSAESDDKIVYGSIRYATGTFEKQRIYPLNVTEFFPNNTSAPSVSEINATADKWMVANDIGQPRINLTVSYAQLGKDVRLHDVVTVHFIKMGIDVKSKVVLYKYDVLKERCTSIEVGHTKPSLLFSLEDASRLKKGLIPPKRIANKSITNSMLGTGSVGSGSIGGGAVKSFHIKDGEVKEENIADDAVTEPKVKPLSITVSRIANGAVQTTKIADNAVITDKIVAKAVTYAKSAYQRTLDQVDINAADIAAINLLFVGGATATSIITQSLTCTGGSQLQGGISTDTINSGNIYCGSVSASGVYVNGSRVALASELPDLSSYATQQYCRNYAGNQITYHQNRCGNYTG